MHLNIVRAALVLCLPIYDNVVQDSNLCQLVIHFNNSLYKYRDIKNITCCGFRSKLTLWLKEKKEILYLGVMYSKSGPICKCMYFCVYHYDCFVLVINHS